MQRRNLRVFFVFLLVLLAAPLSFVAQAASGVEATEVTVRWVPSWGPMRSGLADAGDVNYRDSRYELSAVLRNTGVKPIKSVNFEFIFFWDPEQTEVALKMKYREGKTIDPGGQIKVKRSAVRAATTSIKAIRITKVVYADGSVWKAAKPGT
jgi:hypothetical protein